MNDSRTRRSLWETTLTHLKVVPVYRSVFTSVNYESRNTSTSSPHGASGQSTCIFHNTRDLDVCQGAYLHLRRAQQVNFRSLDALGYLVNDA